MKKTSGGGEAQSIIESAMNKMSAVEVTLTLHEVAGFLQISLNAARALFESGEIVGVSLNQRHAIVLRSDLVSYLRRKAVAQTCLRRGVPDTSVGSNGQILQAQANLTPRRGRRSRGLPSLSESL